MRIIARHVIPLASALLALAALAACDREPLRPAPTAPDGIRPVANAGAGIMYTQVSAGSEHTCGLRADGAVTCWGNNAFGQVAGIPSPVFPHAATFTHAGPFTLVSAGNLHTCALRADGSAVCWGAGVTSTGPDPHWGQSAPPPGPFTQVSGGNWYTCGLLAAGGTVSCWGQYPYLIIPAGSFTQVSAAVAGAHTCALTAGATSSVTCWGWDAYGQVSGTPTGDLPLTFTHPGPFTQVSLGMVHTCVLAANGSIACWGAGLTNTGVDAEWGQSVAPAGTFTQVSAGNQHTCALRTAGTITCWGAGVTNSGAYPNWGQAMPPAGSFVQISAGSSHTCALKADGTIVCWGNDTFNQVTPLPPVLSQEIRFTSAPPQFTLVGGSWAPSAVGGGSGNAVTFTSLTPAVCQFLPAPRDGILHFDAVGTCEVEANQAGNVLYDPAPPERQSFNIRLANTETGLPAQVSATPGSSVTLSAQVVTSEYVTPVDVGAVTFTVRNASNSVVATSAAVAVSAGAASATVSLAALGNGTYTITADYDGGGFVNNSSGIGLLFVLPPGTSVATYSSISTSPSETVIASTGSGYSGSDPQTVTAQATGGTGMLTVGEYSGNPGVGATAFGASGKYFDVHVTPGSTFTSLTILYCTAGGYSSAMWWNGTAWVPVVAQRFDFTTNCITITLNNTTSSPLISELTGTVFTPVNTPATVAITNSAALSVPVAVNTPVLVQASFVEPDGGALDAPHTAEILCGNGSTVAAQVSEAARTIAGTCSSYTQPGVYTVTVKVYDQYRNVGSATHTYVVVYDPAGGFVTGGGWIESPAGAYAPNPSLKGRANFGFVSRYKSATATVPSGETEFRLQAAGLTFNSTSYDVMVVAGPKAQYKGSGTLNGAGNYGFLLTAVDGQVTGGGGVDRFRIKIVDKATGVVVYDNQTGASDTADPTTALGGGSIVIHK